MQRGDACRVVYVDDDIDDRFLFNEAVKEAIAGAEVKSIATGVELLQTLSQEQHLPHVIFLDINMPVMNGFECLSRIRQNPLFNDIKVYMLSTSSANTYMHTATQAGADGYYTKPTSYNNLKILISNCLQDVIPQH